LRKRKTGHTFKVRGVNLSWKKKGGGYTRGTDSGEHWTFCCQCIHQGGRTDGGQGKGKVKEYTPRISQEGAHKIGMVVGGGHDFWFGKE